MKRRIKINGFIIFFAAMAALAFPNVFIRRNAIDALELVNEMFGISFILLGQLFRVSARGYKAEHSKEGRALLQGGPYSLVRNPMYLGIIFIGFGIVLVLFKWWVIIIFLTVFAVRYLLLIFNEERKLLVFFPKEYAGYMENTPRLMPSLGRLLKKDIREYLPIKLYWLKKEIIPIVATLLFAILLESWEDVKEMGMRIYFHEALGILAVLIVFILLTVYLNQETNGQKRVFSGKRKTN